MHILFPYLARYKAVNWTRYHHLFTQLAARGHRITILQPPAADLLETNFQDIEIDLPDNFRIRDVHVPAGLWRRRWPRDKLVRKGLYALFCQSETRRVLAADPPDALLVYNLPQAGILRLKASGGRKLVRIFDLADDYEAMLATELGRFAYKPLIDQGRRTLRRMLADADLVLTISHSLAAQYPQRRIEVLPNGVDFQHFTATKDRLPAPRNPQPVIGYLGAFEYFIDFDLILETAARLPDHVFRLVGGGRDLAAVREQVARRGLSNVQLPGPVSFDKVPEEIAAMDVCLNLFKRIPISHKACPMKLFEYLAMGKPVLTTSLDEINSYGVDFLYLVSDSQEAAAAIKNALGDRESSLRRGEAGREWVRKSYDWRELAARFLELIEGTEVRES